MVLNLHMLVVGLDSALHSGILSEEMDLIPLDHLQRYGIRVNLNRSYLCLLWVQTPDQERQLCFVFFHEIIREHISTVCVHNSQNQRAIKANQLADSV